MKKILHIDMDSFFASVEQQSNPFLRNKPVGIIKERGRTCVIAASREAKRLGIKTGMSIFEARSIYPGILLAPADFDKYFSVSRRFIEICKQFSFEVKVFSIDELFLDVSNTAVFFGGVSGIIRKIKNQIKRELGEYITCSIGISYNYLLAKLASGINKPNGVFEINLENRDNVLFSCRLSDICGIGPRIEKRLLDMGIDNFKTLREIPKEFLVASFGEFWTEELKRLSFGEDILFQGNFFCGQKDEVKSISRTFTLYEETIDLEEIRRVLRNLCEEVGFKARNLGLRGRVIGLALRGRNFTGGLKRKSLGYFLNDGGKLFEEVWRLFERERVKGGVRFLGVWLGGLKRESELSESLFFEERKKGNLLKAMDKVNLRFGEFTVYPGTLLGGRILKREVNGFFGDKIFWLSDFQS